jgi:hypothetical protein
MVVKHYEIGVTIPIFLLMIIFSLKYGMGSLIKLRKKFDFPILNLNWKDRRCLIA